MKKDEKDSPGGEKPGGPERRKRTNYTEEQKRAIVAEALAVGNTAQVAREKDIAENLLYRWMKTYGEEASLELPANTVEGIREQIEKKQKEIDVLKLRLADLVIRG